jgi:DNA-binding NarL/FixJ family response regulator
LAIDAQVPSECGGLARARILVVDDHAFLREGVRQLVDDQDDMDVAGEAADGIEAVTAFARLLPDVTLLDLQMPNMNGLQALERIRAIEPGAKVIVLTTYNRDAEASRALEAGAAGYLLKSGLHRNLIATIRLIHSGGKFIDPEVSAGIARAEHFEKLSPGEVELLSRFARGSRERQIASEFHLTESAVESQLRDIAAKLHAADRTQAVTVALRRGIITL